MNYSEKLEEIMNGTYYSKSITAEVEENDDVFSPGSSAISLPDSDMVELRRDQQKQMYTKEWTKFCSKQWSISHRCYDCAWNAARNGRPIHPAKTSLSPSADDSPTLVTLQSLGQTRDSGYEPSPTSACSFSFSSDEENEQEPDDNPKEGVSPPIDIPNTPSHRIRVDAAKKRSAEIAEAKTPEVRIEVEDEMKKGNAEILRNLVGKGYSIRDKVIWSPRSDNENMRRTKSVPDLSTLPPLPRTPNVQRSGENWPTPSSTIVPCHGRNYSCPATTSDGQALLCLPAPTTSTARASREGLIDLAEEDPEGAHGHKRRVLVLALPDLVKDADNQTGYVNTIDPMPSRGSSSGNISGGNLSSNSSGVDCDTFGPAFRPIRPAWRRPRALSCDVTMEVEVGKELRRIADDFNRTASSSIWSNFANAVRRRLSITSTISESFQTPPESPTEHAQFDFSMDEEFF